MNDRIDPTLIETPADVPAGKPPRRFYTIPQVLFGVLMGGPLAGVFMMRKNFFEMGDEDKASAMGFWGLLAIFPFLFLVIILPENVPGFVVQALSCAVFAGLTTSFQKEAIHAMEKAGVTQRFTHWRMIGVSIVSVVVTFMIAIVIVLGIETIAPEFAAQLFPEEAD